MRNSSKTIALVIAVVSLGVGCVEPPMASPNSDEGHLFIDLEESLAVGWESEVLIMGPATGQQHCDDMRGCYPDSEKVEMLDVTSTDPAVVSVEGFESDAYGESDAVRLELEIHQEGEASLEFQFEVEGREPPVADDGNQGEEQDQDIEADRDDEADDDAGVWSDSYGVEAREVESVQLSRILDEVDSNGPYGLCPESGDGTYLMNSLDDYAVDLRLEKLDDQGNMLRGSGKLPFDIDPEEAVDLEEKDEAHHQVTMTPNEFGTVTISPEDGGSDFESSFMSLAEVSSLDTKLFRLNDEGIRAAEATRLVVDGIYEVAAKPELDSGAALCGGAVETSVESLTPATCEVVGEMADTGNPAITATHGGECHLRIALGDGVVEDWAYSVEYDW